ncbi:MAG TPA: site-specific integrase [Vicinamibacterales bacterium]|nr:site-specific integrase [Vicinamibacterales bacterium]
MTDPDEIGRLLLAIDALESSSSVGDALALLPYVFTRQSELRMMEWSEVDLDGALWTIPAEKTKMRRDHLVPPARQVVEHIRRQPREADARYVFPSLRTRHRPLSEIMLNVALIRAGYSPKQIVPHGFRAMARTLLDERLRVDPILIEVQLAHQVPGVLGDTYNRARYLEQRVEMMQRWADYLDELKSASNSLSGSGSGSSG